MENPKTGQCYCDRKNGRLVIIGTTAYGFDGLCDYVIFGFINPDGDDRSYVMSIARFLERFSLMEDMK